MYEELIECKICPNNCKVNRINNESKNGITIIITEKQLREIQKNSKY